MRFSVSTCAALITAFAAVVMPTLSPAGDKPNRSKKAVAGPRYGVKTPGVLIPIESLRPEAELPEPSKPEWIFFSESIYLPAKSSVEKINTKTNKPGEGIPAVKEPCSGMASAFTSLWVASCGDKSLLRVDPKTTKVTATIQTGTSSVVGGIAASSDSIWLLTDSKTTLTRLDPDQNAVVGEVRLPAGCRSLVFGETALWIACPDQNQVLRINPVTNVVEKSVQVSAEPEALAVGEGSVWVLCRKEGKLDRIDPKTNKVIKTIDLEVPGVEGSLAIGEGSLWVSQAGYPLTRVNTTAEKEKVVQQFYGEGGGALATSPGAIWISDRGREKLLRIDPKRVLATLAE